MSRPAVPVQSWYSWSWSQIEVQATEGVEDSTTERLLRWPQGTIAILREGFEKKLGRQVGWLEPHVNESLLPLSSQSPIAAAAHVFKRGVAHAVGKATSRVDKLQGAYPIAILGGDSDPLSHDPEVWTIVDGEVARLWPKVFDFAPCLTLSLSEHVKTLPTVATILAAWTQRGKPRHWQIVGGGILADVAGFAAAIAGCEMDLIPTTLLAMVDACVGGKTAVNFAPYGKNQIGSWHFPSAVKVWSPWLSTLPQRELISGAMEGLKHCLLLGDLDLAEQLSHAISHVRSGGSWESLNALLPALIGFKAEVVARDPAEVGERAILNLGHTLGHALEALSQENTKPDATLLHGEAVGCGLVYALLLSTKISGLSQESCDQMIGLVRSAGGLMPYSLLLRRLGVSDLRDPRVFSRLQDFMGFDKKNTTGQKPRWVVLEAFGVVAKDQGAWTWEVDAEVLRETWTSFLSRLT